MKDLNKIRMMNRRFAKTCWLAILSLIGSLAQVNGQFISEVLEYVPAPSQYMNAEPWCTPGDANSIVGVINGSVSLGAFGGYIVFRFEEPVVNDPANPFGIDFTIFGNPVPNWSEPGIVSVMKDENMNGRPDDSWYELAGSDHRFSSTEYGYAVEYANPGGDTAMDVPWTDNLGASGMIKANSFASQSYYPSQDLFPGIDQSAYSLRGTMIKSTVDTSYASGIYSLRRSFGYADNQFRGQAPYTMPDNPYTPQSENSGGDAFDISWAIDETGNYIEIDQVDFIRVHSAVMDGAGWLGQVSTEITGAVDVEPGADNTWDHHMIVIREIPPIMDTAVFPLEVFAFRNGRFSDDSEITWSTTMEDAVIDENNIFYAASAGEVTITAALAADNQVTASVNTMIDITNSSGNAAITDPGITIYPNPAREQVWIRGARGGTVTLFDMTGNVLFRGQEEKQDAHIPLGNYTPGLYIIRIESGTKNSTFKLIKE